jgi:hydrogenase maturation factor
VTDAVDQYAVLVNANDIATSGAVPRWFLTTLLFPCGTTPSEIGHVIQSIHAMCNQWGISLCGGHTEITDAVTRPVVTGMMVGIVDRDGLIDKREMALGDKVLLTKKVAVEGTAIIAREFEEKLISAGMYQEEIEEAKGFLSKIGVLEEARIAREASGIHAMHDVTEGGLATALDELSKAGNHRIMVNIDAIPIYPQTEKICNLMGLNPLGLIGSGSLLICCAAEGVDSLIEKIREADIPVSCIGEVTEPGEGLKAVRGGRPAEWPEFERDELARLHE